MKIKLKAKRNSTYVQVYIKDVALLERVKEKLQGTSVSEFIRQCMIAFDEGQMEIEEDED